MGLGSGNGVPRSGCWSVDLVLELNTVCYMFPVLRRFAAQAASSMSSGVVKVAQVGPSSICKADCLVLP